ncbi:MAG: type II toxin-antitoxin system RelE/ParE family toxin [Bacillota bacterium]|nr:type II toxin-antitoxin system RelE/ParE family toxin [Bacillota bacterium]
MKVYQSRSFAQKVKKFSHTDKKELDSVIKNIIKNPDLGVEKKGDLKGVFVHKFDLHNHKYLLTYRLVEKQNLELIVIGRMKTATLN